MDPHGTHMGMMFVCDIASTACVHSELCTVMGASNAEDVLPGHESYPQTCKAVFMKYGLLPALADAAAAAGTLRDRALALANSGMLATTDEVRHSVGLAVHTAVNALEALYESDATDAAHILLSLR
jgi:hypothetical protein